MYEVRLRYVEGGCGICAECVDDRALGQFEFKEAINENEV
jgi:hypothetical protein